MSKDTMLFRYRGRDTPNGITKETARKLAEVLGLNETTLIHYLLGQAAIQYLPNYESDNGPFTEEQWETITSAAPKKKGRIISSIL